LSATLQSPSYTLHSQHNKNHRWKAPHMHSNAAIHLHGVCSRQLRALPHPPQPLPLPSSYTRAWPNTLQCLYLRAAYKKRSFTVLKCTDAYRFWAKMFPPPTRDDDDDDDDHISSHFLSIKPSPSTSSTKLFRFILYWYQAPTF
jgi:hypothetical protein